MPLVLPPRSGPRPRDAESWPTTAPMGAPNPNHWGWARAPRETKVQKKKKKTVKFFMLSLLLGRLSSDVGPLSTLIALMALSP